MPATGASLLTSCLQLGGGADGCSDDKRDVRPMSADVPDVQVVRELKGSTYVLNSDTCGEEEWAQLEAAYDVIARPKYYAATVTARGMARAVGLLGELTSGLQVLLFLSSVPSGVFPGVVHLYAACPPVRPDALCTADVHASGTRPCALRLQASFVGPRLLFVRLP